MGIWWYFQLLPKSVISGLISRYWKIGGKHLWTAFKHNDYLRVIQKKKKSSVRHFFFFSSLINFENRLGDLNFSLEKNATTSFTSVSYIIFFSLISTISITDSTLIISIWLMSSGNIQDVLLTSSLAISAFPS